jgi:succinyl-diaminopimelate desuccinylase
MRNGDSSAAERLAERTLELVDIASPSGSEQAIAGHIRALVPAGLEVVHSGPDSLYVRAPRASLPLVLFAGHIDTIPAQGNLPGRIEDGAVIGCGSTDMKAGVAVMIELARWIATDSPSLLFDCGFLFFPREELPPEQSSIPGLFESIPELAEAELVLVMEPTDNEIQAGCLGNMYADAVFTGESAHSARPWQGVNAIAKAVEGLRPLLDVKPLDLEQGGLTFTEVLSVTGIEAGIAEITSNSPPAPVPASSALLERLRKTGDLELTPKQAWTPVAEFAERGLDAVNFGPGSTRYAHKADERAEIEKLERSFEILRHFLCKET